ncbi:MAG: tetR1 [Acidimicrobiales bacterium]|nr:tetR1 [Acidimicrobiales bacterium]
MRIVRKDGRDALSMRRLAAELGVTPMALYHHVADKPALMDALIEQVWLEVIERAAGQVGDPIETILAICICTRDVWLENSDLANLAVAVAEPDDVLFASTRIHTALFEAAGFPDVPLAFSAVQNFTMGAIQIAANRRAASAYFGRNPRALLAKGRRLFTKRGATANHRGVLEARFDEGDERHFEPALRALLAGLLAH